MQEYLISIIVPFYNPGGNFRRCLDSLIHQTYGNLEIILIDDGSTDGSYEIAKEYAQKDSALSNAIFAKRVSSPLRIDSSKVKP